jgi:hypothetical protein
MFSQARNVTIVLVIIAASMCFQLLLERFWPRSRRREHNEVIGWQLGILGTTYAVILGFMLYTVWTNFGQAQLNTEAEANAATNIFRLCASLPPAEGNRLRHAIRTYVDSVVQKDWPAMEAGGTGSIESHVISQQLWQMITNLKLEGSELSAQDHILSEMSSLAEHRRVRQLECTSRLPDVLWWVLVVGAVVTVISVCMLGGTNGWLHSFQVFCFSALIALVLVAISDIDHPFQGSVYVAPDAFLHAQTYMNWQ